LKIFQSIFFSTVLLQFLQYLTSKTLPEATAVGSVFVVFKSTNILQRPVTLVNLLTKRDNFTVASSCIRGLAVC
jgi:hypothetical protein